MTRFERFLKWCGYVRLDYHKDEIIRAMATQAKATALKNEEIVVRAAKTEEMEVLYRLTLETLNAERTRWLAVDVNGVHQLDSNALVHGEMFLNAFDRMGVLDGEVVSAANRFRDALHERRPL